MNWDYIYWLGTIPFVWMSVNRCRACISKWAANRRYRNTKRRNESLAVRELPEVQTYCTGCDQIVPESWMAWMDADNDGVIGELYRCRVCRGVLDPVESQQACNTRMEQHFAANYVEPEGKLLNPNGHDAECQCSNCEPWTIPYQEMTEAQVENARKQLDLSQLLAPEYTAAVEHYRGYGIDATNETDALYRERIAKRNQRRQAELRAKYHMDSEEWRNNVRYR